MNGMFCGCSSLLIIPDISKWKTDNLTEFNLIFYGCSSLFSYPDISKWNNEKIKNYVFLSSSSFSNSEIIDKNYSINELANNSFSSINQNLNESKKNDINNEVLDINNFQEKDDELNDYYENFYN